MGAPALLLADESTLIEWYVPAHPEPLLPGKRFRIIVTAYQTGELRECDQSCRCCESAEPFPCILPGHVLISVMNDLIRRFNPAEGRDVHIFPHSYPDFPTFQFGDCRYGDQRCSSCRNGNQIDSGNRCNRVNNCGDMSDESGCEFPNPRQIAVLEMANKSF